MGSRLSNEEVQSRLNQFFVERVKLVGEYKNRRELIDLKCEECGYEWKAAPNSVLYEGRHRCPNCKNNENKNGKYVKTETLSSTDLAGYTPISYGLHNDKDKKGDNVIVWKNKDNNIITTRMPLSLNAAAVATTTNLVQNATEWNMVAKGNKRPKLAVINGVPVIQRDAKGNIVYDGVMTDADRAAFQEAADRAAQDLYRVAGSNLNVRYESKPVSLVPFGQ